LTDPLIYVRAVHFAATILAAGGVFFQVLVAAPAFAAMADDPAPARLRRQWSWLIGLSLAVAVVSAALWLVLLAAEIDGASVVDAWRDGSVWTVATAIRFGQITWMRFALAVALALSLPRSVAAGGRRRFVAAALATGLLIAPALTGHAGAAPGVAGQFQLAADALHLLAAGAWVGGLLPLAMLLAAACRSKDPSWTAVVSTAVRRFSLLGIASVAALLASGLVNTWYDVGGFAALVDTAYGRLVVLKLGLFAAMVAIAAVNKFRLTPRLAAASAVRGLQRNSLIEAALGFAAVAAVGALGAMAPASHAHQHPAGAIPADAAFVHIHSTQGMADVTITPGHIGQARATIRLWNDDFAPLAAREVTLTLTAPTPGSKPVMRLASPAPDGAWQVDGIALEAPGNWTVAVGITLRPAGRLVLDAPIVIEP
jgi:putative copper resistance protein D